MKIVEPRARVTISWFEIWYTYPGRTGRCAFECDEEGNVDESALHPAGLANLLKGREEGTCTGIERFTTTHTTPAVGECSCGRRVTLRNFTNTCGCGADYNSSGQLLACRSQWGEETGEHWTDCY